jgi:hypothetical protein
METAQGRWLIVNNEPAPAFPERVTYVKSIRYLLINL